MANVCTDRWGLDPTGQLQPWLQFRVEWFAVCGMFCRKKANVCRWTIGRVVMLEDLSAIYFLFPPFLPPFLPLALSSSSPAAAFALFLPRGVLAYHVYNQQQAHSLIIVLHQEHILPLSTGCAKKNKFFWKLINIAIVSGRKACDMSKVLEFYLEKV